MTVLKLFDDKEYMKMSSWDASQELIDILPEPVLVQSGIWQIETQDLDIEVFLDGNRVVKYRCSCNKTKSKSQLCPHLIVLILKIGWIKQRNKPVKSAFEYVKYLPQKIGWKQVLDTLDTNELYQFCTEILKGNSLGKQILLAKYGDKITGLDDDSLVKQVFPNWDELFAINMRKGIPSPEFKTLTNSLKIYQQHLLDKINQEEWQSAWDIFKIILFQVQKASKYANPQQSSHLFSLSSKCLEILDPMRKVRLSPTLSASIHQIILYNSLLKYFIDNGLYIKFSYFLIEFSLVNAIRFDELDWLEQIKSVNYLKNNSQLSVLEEIVYNSFADGSSKSISEATLLEIVQFYKKNDRIDDLIRFLEHKSKSNIAFKPFLFQYKSMYFPKDCTSLAIELWDKTLDKKYLQFLQTYLSVKKYDKWLESSLLSIEDMDVEDKIKAYLSFNQLEKAKSILFENPDLELWTKFLHEPGFIIEKDDFQNLEHTWVQFLQTHLGKKPIVAVLKLVEQLPMESQDIFERFQKSLYKKFPDRFSNFEKISPPKIVFT